LKKIDSELSSLNEKISGLEETIQKLERKATRNVDI
jgi:prefoldin subunit 5